MSKVFNDQDNEVHIIMFTVLHSFTINRNPSLDDKLSTKIYIDDELGKNTVFRLKQTLQNYLKVPNLNDV